MFVDYRLRDAWWHWVKCSQPFTSRPYLTWPSLHTWNYEHILRAPRGISVKCRDESCIHTYMYACMYTCMYLCMYVCMHACMHAFMLAFIQACKFQALMITKKLHSGPINENWIVREGFKNDLFVSIRKKERRNFWT